ncbi:unnamed protein product [Ectocarpus sp. 12 AP-2014]
MNPPTTCTAVPSEPVLTGSVRKTLLQQQTEYTVRDPSTHAARQVRELDTFAGSMGAKKRACLEQIEKDRQELGYIDSQINSEARKYDALLESLSVRRAERDRLRKHLERCKGDNDSLMGDAFSRTSWVRREDSRMLKSVSSIGLEAARGFGSGPGTTFSRKRSRGGGSANTLPPLGGRSGSGSGDGGGGGRMNHSISAPALRR